jgi:hypothetical protein
MAFTAALYYPWIEIANEGWLKSAFLYWDSVRTIVPESISRPYTSITAREFEDAGILVPLRVQSEMEEIENLTDDVIKYLDSPEAAELLIADKIQSGARIHMEKLPSSFRKLSRIHPDKLSSEVRYSLFNSGIMRGREKDWYNVDTRFADFYMTLLATRLSERVGTGLLTDEPTSDKLALTVRLDASVSSKVKGFRRRRGEYSAEGRRREMPSTLAQGMLADLILEKIDIDPDTPVTKILNFRNNHAQELGRFRTKVDELTKTISSDLPVEHLRQRVNDIYINEVLPSTEALKQGLTKNKIKWVTETGLKVAFLSASTSSLTLTAFGLSVPQALLVGTGVSLTASTILYNLNKRDTLEENPFAYILSASKNL